MKNECPPVMLCAFNRPECLNKVFDVVRQIKPTQLFLALDAPREGRPSDVPRCEECKRIYSQVDWPCEVHRNYAQANMGCRNRMASAITWTFEHVDRAIILEDDCVPELTFFRFCSELLDKYADDDRVGGVCGFAEHWSFARKPVKVDADYYFDRLNTCCGWATWRRAWKNYDAQMEQWPQFKKRRIFRPLCKHRYEERAFERMVQSVYDGACSSWATIWFISALNHGYVFAHSVNNLITNVGFGGEATHSLSNSPLANLPMSPVSFPLRHPIEVMPNFCTERFMVVNQYATPLWLRVWARAKRFLIRK